jgi:nucleoside-diphosphate-sugar epimerase
VVLVGEGDSPANTIYVDNLASAVVLALGDDRAVGRKLVAVDEDGVTWRGLYERLAGLVDPPPAVRTVPLEEWRARSARRGSLRDALRELRALLRSPEAAALARAAASRPALRRAGAKALRVVPGGRRRAHGFVRPHAVAHAPAQVHEELPGPELAAVQTAGAVFHARGLRSLGWTPPVSADEAFALTAEWLRFARQLDP